MLTVALIALALSQLALVYGHYQLGRRTSTRLDALLHRTHLIELRLTNQGDSLDRLGKAKRDMTTTIGECEDRIRLIEDELPTFAKSRARRKQNHDPLVMELP